MLSQHLLSAGKIIAEHIIRQYTVIIHHREGLMRKQGRHTKPRIGGQYGELRFQFGTALRIVQHAPKQFLSHLIAHGV